MSPDNLVPWPGQPEEEPGQWLTLAELAARSGAHIDKVRSWRKRAQKAGALRWRKGNDAQVHVWVTPAVLARLAQPDSPAGQVSEPRAEPAGGSSDPSAPAQPPQPDGLAELVEELRAGLARSEERAARLESTATHLAGRASRAEIELAVTQARLEERDRLLAERAERITDLQARLSWLGRPWWRRLGRG